MTLGVSQRLRNNSDWILMMLTNYVAAEKHDLVIVSFDSDFDRTERRRLMPDQALERIRRRR